MLTKEQQEQIKTLADDKSLSAREIAGMVGCYDRTVYNYFRRFGIDRKTKFDRHFPEIIAKLNAGAKAVDVAVELGVSLPLVYMAGKMPGCNWPTRHQRKDSEDVNYRNNEIKKLRGLGYEQARIGRIFNISRERVRQILEEL